MPNKKPVTLAFWLSQALLACFIFVGPAVCQQSSATAEKSATDEAEADEQVSTKRPKDSEHFMRIRKDGKGRPVALETSITRYELTTDDGERITVDLIGAVHIGEQAYYDQLNKRFEKYESMLYELVAPEGTVIPKGGGRGDGIPTNPIAAMQVGMQSALGLEFQLEHIDYTKSNFTHADMSPKEFAESMKMNDESISKYALRAIGQSMAMQSAGKGGDSMGMIFAMFSKNKELRMRRAFAIQIQQMEAGMVVFQGADGSTIIDHRNAKCMRILQEEIDAGKRNFAIFYGAGHLPDMQRRLTSDFKMKRGGQNWLEAWSLTNRGKDTAEKSNDK
jgi:hypothetical protein